MCTGRAGVRQTIGKMGKRRRWGRRLFIDAGFALLVGSLSSFTMLNR
jgi:hypothetical protein